MLERIWRKGNPLALLVGMWTDAATLETVWRFLIELKIDLTYNTAIAFLEIYPRDTNTMKCQNSCTTIFIAAMSTKAKLWKKPQFPTDEWIKNMWDVYTHTVQEGSPFSTSSPTFVVSCLVNFHHSHCCEVIIEIWRFFKYSDNKYFIRYMFCKYFVPTCDLAFLSLNHDFEEHRLLILNCTYQVFKTLCLWCLI